ncbi:hypothetical protein EN828_10515 [Mesorhizobium sp. M2D.F.Ca.ET.185.01.1.1]|uniref:hypothetical protein n=1 Tax=unclassified Mesorhizobium TaxID=325217 RepID=UPI000FD75CCA|nr:MULTISPECIES: hypothetical protein [unclassified Mesorhizobium]TGT95865.1 hypothetical protein EN806_53810 [bacterium M00.F.Ca.ET.163.01.1.1]TGV81414.1 hypothetical protein EN792_034750 [Mesorhizobium sp. M00.F.Ca.ET.149.01.1.1]TGP25904.1 hypothetical protein EN875_034405 [Mesorhizobium sp. M2D.F.Ca.ET.232.01.1.1]TGP25910.1 hypothetical protein EN875_034375 [Mesorhizobium sp. M2D.F.Ca.ET.232.01.1.1]TGQ23826.1 hypothetical protein EN863_064850 [Mesorhizobium sp. M00.F.Ca.ET.220.01.1.1]
MTEAEIRRIVSETVDQTLTRLGVDTENPIEFQRDLQHLRAWRESVATVKKQSLITAVGIVIAGALGLLWLGFKGSP